MLLIFFPEKIFRCLIILILYLKKHKIWKKKFNIYIISNKQKNITFHYNHFLLVFPIISIFYFYLNDIIKRKNFTKKKPNKKKNQKIIS